MTKPNRKAGAPAVHKNHALAGGPYIMGVVNVTPDFFSDGGKFINPDKAIAHGVNLIFDGADILDIGGESTRPGAEEIDAKEEIARIVPVIKALKGKARWISVDTRKAEVMEAAISAGANLINDISALIHSPRSVDVIAEAKVPVILMHIQGEPKTMQKNPIYKNVIEDVFAFLSERIKFCETRRIDPRMIICDPGIGFGKTLEHNLALIRNISRFHDLDVPIALGASRKSFLSKLAGVEGADDPEKNRLAGSIATVTWGLSQGVQIYRVHDVRETRAAIKTYQALSGTCL